MARAPADGYTLLIGTSAARDQPGLYKQMPYDPVKDFAPVTHCSTRVPLLVVHPSVPAKTLTELIAHAKRSPGKLTYASGGNGSPSHLAGELFKSIDRHRHRARPLQGQRAGAHRRGRRPVPRCSTRRRRRCRRSRRAGCAPWPSPRGRSEAAPDLPTIAESGLPGFESGVVRPARAGRHAARGRRGVAPLVNEILAQPDVVQRLAADGAEAGTGSIPEFDAYIRLEIEKWAKAVKSSGAVMN